MSDEARLIFEKFFSKNRMCIINTDLDGILSGMILQKYLGWEIVGFSNCSGSKIDELWLKNDKIDIDECVFVDLPVCIEEIDTVDQHFVLFDEDNLIKFKGEQNKINPNIIRGKLYIDSSNKKHYTEKYPFGTVHFVIAILERLNIITEEFQFNIRKQLSKGKYPFELVDLILRADRVIGNTNAYTPNCINWADWMIRVGGINTNNIFTIVKNEYAERLYKEKNVENILISNYGTKKDGECSELFRDERYEEIQRFLNYLGKCMEMDVIKIFPLNKFGKLEGYRLPTHNYNIIKNTISKEDMFSYAFVSMKELSVTLIKEV